MKSEPYAPAVLSTERVFSHPLISIRRDLVRIRERQQQDYLVIEYHSAVAVVAFTADNEILMVRVPRYPIGEYLWELPGGRLELGEDPLECARRELAEETGWAAGNLEPLLTFYPESSFSTERLHLFRATDMKFSGNAIPEREGMLQLRSFPLATAMGMIGTGEIRSSWSIIGILIANLPPLGQ